MVVKLKRLSFFRGRAFLHAAEKKISVYSDCSVPDFPLIKQRFRRFPRACVPDFALRTAFSG